MMNDIDSIKYIVDLIANNGVMIIISAVMIIFVFKVLDMLLKQNKQITESIMPKLEEIEKKIDRNRTDVIGSVTTHNTFVQTELSDIERDVETTMNTVKRVDDEQHKLFMSSQK